MKQSPKLSFIIPTYNFGKYIGACIESIKNQTISNIEIIIINDGSTDDSKSIIDGFTENDIRISAIHKKNEGVSTARNVGIEHSTGEYVCFIDADDYISPDFAEYMLSIAKTSDADFCISRNCYTKKDESQVAQEHVDILNSSEATTLLLSPCIIVGSWNKIYKRSVLIEKGLRFSTSLFYGEGLHFITRFAQASKNIAVTNKKLYYYRRNNYSSATSKFNIEKFINGSKAIDEIENSLTKKTPEITDMLNWHRCQFKMGTVVRIKSSKKVNEYLDYYNECLRYVRTNTFKCLKIKNVSLYKKALLIGCCISPYIMARMDDLRRKRISQKSV